MNFKMKALVAAVALTASMSASAAMTNTESGDSSLILTLVDNTNDISATFNLGYTHSTFDRASNMSWDIDGGDYASAWNTFWTTADAATTQFAVFSGDSLGSAAGEVSYFTTVSSFANVSNSKLKDSMRSFDGYINDNSILQGAGIASTANATSSGSAWAEKSVAYGTTGKIGANGSDANGFIDSKLTVYTYTNNSGSLISSSTASKLPAFLDNGVATNPYFMMTSNGSLTYTAAVAAVPEADSWAMLLAGLGLMGFIARRRTAA